MRLSMGFDHGNFCLPGFEGVTLAGAQGGKATSQTRLNRISRMRHGAGWSATSIPQPSQQGPHSPRAMTPIPVGHGRESRLLICLRLS